MLLVAAGLPVVAAAVLAVEVQLARTGPRLPDVAHDFDGGSPDAPLAVWLGDSTAAGVGADEAEETVPLRVAAATGERVRVLAVSGATVAEVVEDQLPLLEGLDPARIYVSVGSNDVTHLTGASDFRQSYEELVRRLPDVPLILLGVPDMGSPPRLAQPLRAIAGLRGRQLDKEIRRIAAADKRATYVDIAGHTGPPFRRDPDRYFSADKYHPSGEGYRLWSEAVVRDSGG
ncbi:MAG: SGNH/GDSL hydrolase family protein [Acidimicrobiia bacterium]